MVEALSQWSLLLAATTALAVAVVCVVWSSAQRYRMGRAVRDLQRSESRSRAIIGTSIEGIITIGDRGLIESFNPAAERIFGYDADMVLGRNVSVLMPEPDRSRHDEYVARFLRTGDARIIGIGREVVGQRLDGSTFPMDLSVAEFRVGKERHFAGIVRDLSERKALEERLRLHGDALAHVGRVRLAGEMAAGIAHEINQPLAAISNYAQAAARGFETGRLPRHELAESLREIRRQAERAAGVIRSLRALVRKGDSVRESSVMNVIVRDALALARLDGRASSCRLETELSPDLPPVMVDRIQIGQVLINLIQNALEAMQEGGIEERVVTVRTTRRDGGMLETSVTDSGPGLASDVAEELFHPFFSTKSDGLGLGLPLCSTIIRDHGGRLWHVPGPGGGASFRFTLPFTDE